MDNDNNNSEEIHRNLISEHIQSFISKQTILYIQYCLFRVPFLLVYDYLFTKEFYFSIESFIKYVASYYDNESFYIFIPIKILLNSFFFQLLISTILILIIPILGFILLIIFLLCSNRRLLIIYSYTISYLIIYFFYQINHSIIRQKYIFIFQFILSIIYLQILNIYSHIYIYKIQKFSCYFSLSLFFFTRYLFPLNVSIYLLNIYYSIWLLINIFDLILSLYDIIKHALRTDLYDELLNLYENFSIDTLADYLYEHVHLSILLKIFWLIKVFIVPLGIRTIYSNPYIITKYETVYNVTLMKTIYFTCLYYGTETMFTLISFSCVISYGMKYLSNRLFRLLHIWTEDVEQIGIVMGVMFFLLLFQSNLTRIDLNRRHVPLLKAFSLLIVVLFHFIHTVLESQLLKVAMQSATNNTIFRFMDENKPSIKYSYIFRTILNSFHHRYIYTSISILFLLIFYIILLWHVTSFSTWLLAITAFLLELIVRLISSLAQYILYILDGHNCLTNDDSFDEYIFRIKALTSIFEFMLGIFLLLNGIYIFYYENRGALRAFMLVIHAYLNIVKNLRRGWQILRNRRTAWKNVNQLPIATEEQIQNYNDICSICHGILTYGTTCITPCSHFFHQKCLQKVLYATQNCALCLRPIIIESNTHQQ